jgi:hypothetical protein
MQIIYGKGIKAFEKLQEAIIKRTIYILVFI